MVSSAIAVDQLGLASDPTFPISCGNYHWSSLQTDWGKFPSPSSLHQLSFRSQWVCPPPWLPAPFRRCWADYEALCFLSEVPLPSCFLPHLQGPQVLRFLERGGISIRQVCKNTGKQNVGMLLSRVVSTQLSKLSGNTGFWVNMNIYIYILMYCIHIFLKRLSSFSLCANLQQLVRLHPWHCIYNAHPEIEVGLQSTSSKTVEISA